MDHRVIGVLISVAIIAISMIAITYRFNHRHDKKDIKKEEKDLNK